MEIYQSEDEELEALKRWWRENGRAVMVGAALGVAVIVGWNLWKERQRQVAEEASGLYQQLTKAMEAKQVDAAVTLGDQIIQKYASTAYATFARLAQAKLKVEAGDLPAARRALEDVLASKAEPYFKHVARLRLGQILLAANDAAGALKLVEDVQAQGFGAFEKDYLVLKGDSQSALGKVEEARQSYQSAERLGAQSALLEMKLEDLGVPTEPVH